MTERCRLGQSTPQTTIEAVMHCVRERGLPLLVNQQTRKG